MPIAIRETEKQLKALGNRRRLAILKYLHGVTMASVGDIAAEIKLSFKSTSRHLAVLRAAEIVDKEQQGLVMYYHLSKPTSNLTKLVLALC